MSEQQLRNDIEELKQTLATANVDAETSAHLETLVQDMEQQLNDGVSEAAKHLLEQVQDSVTRFEVSHPSLTQVLNNILQTLANMGV